MVMAEMPGGLLKEEINLPRGASLQAFITLVRGLVINVSH